MELNITLEDVKISTSLIHKGCVAPKGQVFYVATIKVGKTTYSRYIPIDRMGATKEKEEDFIQQYKENFFNQVIEKLKRK